MVGGTYANPEVGFDISVNGLHTNYHDLGSGPPIVLIHGSGPGVSAWANWRLNLTPLSTGTGMRVLAPDLVGFGHSDKPEGFDYNLANWVTHLAGFLDKLELPRVSLIGNSFGGAVSLAMASRYPARIDRMVLMGSVGVSFPITKELESAWGYQPSVENMRNLLDMFAYDSGLVSDELARIRYGASVRPGVQEAFEAMFPAPRQQSLDALVTAPDIIRKSPHETLIIHGREDRVIPLQSSLRLLDLIPRAQLHVFGHSGHWTQIEQATKFNKLVVDFLAG